eukprot:scaffold110353_cov67-Phaeocystis_antarctica.AAC.4
MFAVRFARSLALESTVRPSPCMPLPPPSLHALPSPRPTSRLASYVPSLRSAGRKRLVRRQQAVHPLRMGGHPGLRPFWLWLELGSGKLPLTTGRMCARDWSRVYGGCSDNSPLLYSSLMRGAAAVIKP